MSVAASTSTSTSTSTSNQLICLNTEKLQSEYLTKAVRNKELIKAVEKRKLYEDDSRINAFLVAVVFGVSEDTISKNIIQEVAHKIYGIEHPPATVSQGTTKAQTATTSQTSKTSQNAQGTAKAQTATTSQMSKTSQNAQGTTKAQTATTSQTSKTPQNLIISNTNQYQVGANNPSLCTSCAAAFLLHLKTNGELSSNAITEVLEVGATIHQVVTEAKGASGSANFNAKEVIEHGGVGLKETSKAFTSRPQSAKNLSDHYQKTLIPVLTDKSRQHGGVTAAIFTKAPYSAGIAYQNNQFFFFDSHGEQDTGNRAFIRVFNEPKAFCDYLVKRYGFVDFPDVDFDIYTGQDNPNCYELTFV